MFALGWLEIVVVLGLLYLALRGYLARRFPGFRRAFDAVFYLTVALLIVFGLLTRIH